MDLDKALSLPGLEAEQRGEALLDRARAAEAQNDIKTARAKLNEAAQTISDDPFYWYFSAALAIRESDADDRQDGDRQGADACPSDPTILFEAGHVADFTGDDDQARSYWMRAAASDPNGPVGKAAAKAIEMLGVTPTVKAEAPPPAKTLAQVVIDRRHDADLLERRAAARGAAIVAVLAVAGADREIALAGRLDPADRSAAVAGELLGAVARVLVRLARSSRA